MFMDRAGNASSSTGVGAKWLVLQRRRRRNGHILLWLRRVLSCPGISIITRPDVHGHAYGRHDVHIFALFDMANHCPRVSDVKRQGWYSVSLTSPTIQLITNLVTEFVAAVLAERLQSINHHRGNAQLPMVALLLMRFSSDSEIWFHSVCRESDWGREDDDYHAPESKFNYNLGWIAERRLHHPLTPLVTDII